VRGCVRACVRAETAVTVGYSCRLLSSSDTIDTFVVDADTAEGVRAQLVSARDQLCRYLMAGQLVLDRTELAPWMTRSTAAASIGQTSKRASDVPAAGCCALVISGHSLVCRTLYTIV